MPVATSLTQSSVEREALQKGVATARSVKQVLYGEKRTQVCQLSRIPKRFFGLPTIDPFFQRLASTAE
jgi:hypothetical protein